MDGQRPGHPDAADKPHTVETRKYFMKLRRLCWIVVVGSLTPVHPSIGFSRRLVIEIRSISN